MSEHTILIGLMIGVGLEILNVWGVWRFISRESLGFGKAIPIVPLAINVYFIAHIQTSLPIKIIGFLLAATLEVITFGVFPVVYGKWFNGTTPLHIAASKGDKDAVQVLLEQGMDINTRNNRGYSAIEFAALHGHAGVVDLLASNGADLTVWTGSVWGNARLSVLGMAAAEGRLEVVKVLLARGESVNDTDGHGSSVLNAAIDREQREVIRLLLEYNPNLGPARDSGLTPVHEVAHEKYLDILDLLLKHGADINSPDNWGRTPLAYVKEYTYKSDEVVKFLLERGGHE
ncbi:MAG: ankyrin repeat domain-containing protein [Armatimonadota bacterium]|nr:ankyrin repeat domain-containing protein [Armatimonadota bacterium]